MLNCWYLISFLMYTYYLLKSGICAVLVTFVHLLLLFRECRVVNGTVQASVLSKLSVIVIF